MLCTLVLQAVQSCDWSEETQNALISVINNTDLWANYRIARVAARYKFFINWKYEIVFSSNLNFVARYGHYRVCSKIVSQLREKVSSEHFHFWLVAFNQISYAEASLSEPAGSLLERLENSITHYNCAIASLKVIVILCSHFNI